MRVRPGPAFHCLRIRPRRPRPPGRKDSRRGDRRTIEQRVTKNSDSRESGQAVVDAKRGREESQCAASPYILLERLRLASENAADLTSEVTGPLRSSICKCAVVTQLDEFLRPSHDNLWQRFLEFRKFFAECSKGRITRLWHAGVSVAMRAVADAHPVPSHGGAGKAVVDVSLAGLFHLADRMVRVDARAWHSRSNCRHVSGPTLGRNPITPSTAPPAGIDAHEAPNVGLFVFHQGFD